MYWKRNESNQHIKIMEIKQYVIKSSCGKYAAQQEDRNGMVFMGSDAVSATKFTGSEIRGIKDRHGEQWQNNGCKVFAIEITETQVVM